MLAVLRIQDPSCGCMLGQTTVLYMVGTPTWPKRASSLVKTVSPEREEPEAGYIDSKLGVSAWDTVIGAA